MIRNMLRGNQPLLASCGHWLRYSLLALAGVLLVGLCHPLLANLPWPSNSPLQPTAADQVAFNQIDYYPLQQEMPANLYRPTGKWMGRLILPGVEQYQQVQQASQETDWAWFEVWNTPPEHQALAGKTVRLAWAKTPRSQTYVSKATRDVRLNNTAKKSMEAGRIHPFRLDGRDRVGPLQSLAGFRPLDDITVVLKGKVRVEGQQPGADSQELGVTQPPTNASPVLRINREPVMETGRYYALVKVLEAVAPPAGYALPTACPGAKPCASEFLRVRHYNRATKQFDGPEGVIRLPQQPPDSNGVFASTPRELPQSPVGRAGWYIYGARDKNGIFTVQALKPRSLFQLKPEAVITGQSSALKYIRNQNFKDTEQRKGTAQSVLVQQAEITPEAAIAQWQTSTEDTPTVGSRSLVMHLFGARGGEGKLGENSAFGTYTGHFAYGLGQVIQDPFTGEPQFKVDTIQIYSNNPAGITSGVNTWANYLGNTRRGRGGTHPVSDVLIQLDELTDDYQFGTVKFSFLDELLAELSLLAARYRIGDGSGTALISAATSCVQDANQALYNTIRRFQLEVQNHPQAREWLRSHPNDPQVQRFRRLARLSFDLYNLLTPMGVVRWDWNQNADIVLGTQPNTGFTSLDQLTIRNTLTGLLSWRTALPRLAHDEVATVFLRNGGSLWFLRPNQVGGNDPSIYPIAPTYPLGAWTLPFSGIPIFSILLIRIFASLRIPYLVEWWVMFLALAGFGLLAYLIGTRDGFLRWQPWQAPWPKKLLMAVKLFFMPALLEELVFRVLLLPEPGRLGTTESAWWLWALLSLGLFVIYHLVNATFFYTVAKPTFFQPTFLILAALLGLTCTIVYRITGSLWTIAFIHWVAVLVWLFFLGGMERLDPQKRFKSANQGSNNLKLT